MKKKCAAMSSIAAHKFENRNIIIQIQMTSNCSNCKNIVCRNILLLQNDSKQRLFHTLCIQCMNTCSECGGDIGISKSSNLISNEECAICDHQNCRSCGLNLRCNKHDITICEHCIDGTPKFEICNCLKYKLHHLRKSIGH